MKAKIEADMNKQWEWGGMGTGGWTRWIQKETLRRENLKFGSRWGGGVLTRVEKIMVLDEG